ncbi:hypothetical protein BGW42_003294 [Actinomortierella wolfii]|nr:hypothetical protein BGW42_003294 [Actinomortierella wolfii]
MVTYNATSNLKYCCIKIRFTGTVETKVSKTQDQVYVINQQSVLLGNANHENEYVLNEGEYAWPFEFTLPMQHIPSVGKYRHGAVKYTLTAIITSKGFMGGMQEQKRVKQINIRDLINCMAAPHTDPIQFTESFNLKPSSNKPKDNVSAKVQLARSAFLPGQQLCADIDFVHPVSINRNPACWVQLVRKERYQAGENVREYSQVVARSNYAIKIDHEDKTGFVKVVLEIPRDCLYSTSTTKIMTVQYYLLFLFDLRAKTGMFERRNPNKITKRLRAKLIEGPGGIEKEIPITIGTLADLNHAPRVATVITPIASSTASPSVTASTVGPSTTSVSTPTSGSTSSVLTASPGVANLSVPVTHPQEHPVPPPPPKDEHTVHGAYDKYTPQSELYHGTSASSSSSATAAQVADGKGRRLAAALSSDPSSSSSSTQAHTGSTVSPSHTAGASTFNLQPMLNALPDVHYPATTSGYISNNVMANGTHPTGPAQRRGSHPPPSRQQPMARSAPMATPAPYYQTLPTRQIHHMAPQGEPNPSSAAYPATSRVAQFYPSSQASQVFQSHQAPPQSSHMTQAPQSSATAIPPRSLPSQVSQQRQDHGSQGHHIYVAPPVPVHGLNVFAVPAPLRPPLPQTHSALSAPMAASQENNVDSRQFPPRPPPQHTNSVPPLPARPQNVPNSAHGSHQATEPGSSRAYDQQYQYLPRMASTPEMSNGYISANNYYTLDQKPPHSPAPITIDPPFHASFAHRESPTAPRAIDLGYGPASPMLENSMGTVMQPMTPLSSSAGIVALPPTTVVSSETYTPAVSASLANPVQRQFQYPPSGDYFTASSLAPAPPPMPHATSAPMVAASAPRFSLVFGSSSSTAPSTPTGIAAASLATTATAATTTSAFSPAVTAHSGHAGGVLVLSPTHDDHQNGIAPPYVPSAASGQRTM